MFVCVDDYSMCIWVNFICEKSDTFTVFEALCTKVQREKGKNIGKVVRIRSDHEREFENSSFSSFYDS